MSSPYYRTTHMGKIKMATTQVPEDLIMEADRSFVAKLINHRYPVIAKLASSFVMQNPLCNQQPQPTRNLMSSGYTSITKHVITSLIRRTVPKRPTAILKETASTPGSYAKMARSATPKQRSKSLLAERSQKRSAPARGDWPDPSHYTNKDKFLQEEVREIASHDKIPEVDIGYEPKFVRHGVSEHVDHDDVGMITSNWVVFKSEVTALALEGLYGCTSVVLVSRRGAWISHIFEEDMAFEPKFRYRVLEEMHEGLPPNHPSHRLFQYGLDDLIRKPRRGNAGVMFGDDEETPQSLGMRAFIVTPRPRPQRELGNGEFLSDDVLMHDTTINRGHIQYQRSVQRLAHNLTQTYGDIPVEVIDYAPAIVPNGLYRKLNDPNRRHHSDSQRVNREVAEYFSKALAGTPRGKLLLQYRPAKTCGDLASWRLWVEDQEVGSRTDGWTPACEQVFQYGGLNQRPVRRQTCPTPLSQNTPMIGARSSTFTFSSPSARCQPQGTVEVRYQSGGIF